MQTLGVRAHYDFASTLCYVAHRVMGRLAEPLAALGVELLWTPVDLTRLIAREPAGAAIDELRRANAARVAEELGVRVRVPRVWPDARALGALALVAEAAGRGASWRERAFGAVFEEGRLACGLGDALALAREVGLAPEPEAVAAADDELERRSAGAREELVTGVPTFMLGSWPFGGIQSDETMLRVLERYTRRARAGLLA
jgi:predicted DsbA family dithiol-disulfide isomerase